MIRIEYIKRLQQNNSPSIVISVILVVSFSRSGLSPLFPAVCGFLGSSTGGGGGSWSREMAE